MGVAMNRAWSTGENGGIVTPDADETPLSGAGRLRRLVGNFGSEELLLHCAANTIEMLSCRIDRLRQKLGEARAETAAARQANMFRLQPRRPTPYGPTK
jgi:hypothetical protein